MSEYVKYKVDASSEGCTGMFWRSKPDMGATKSDPNWPRNGTVIEAREPAEHPGWVVTANNDWLPIKQKGYTVVHKL